MPFSTWVLLYGLAGFIALSYELVWFRLLGVMLKSTAFTFGTLLAQYLFWLGVGGALGGIIASRLKRPAFAFLIIQCAAGVYAGLALTLLVAEVPAAASLKWLHDYFGGYEPIEIAEAVAMLRGALNDALWHTVEIADLPLRFGALYAVLPAVLIAPATLLMGLSFPVLQRVVQTDVTMVGRRTGVLLLANIAGSTLGAMLTGWLLLGVLGTAGTLKALVVLAAAFALAAWRRAPGGRQRMTAGALAALSLVVATCSPTAPKLWSVMHGTTERMMLLSEDASGVSVLRQSALNPAAGVTVFVNGLGQSHLPFGGIHTELGAIPALLHPNPLNAAIIGLGSGDTLFGAAGRRELQRIVSIEIIRPQLDTLAMLYQRYPYPGLATVLSDPRVEHVFADGRLVLKTSGELFDIIEADALRPTSAFSGNLYSDEYFRLMQARLKPGGYAVTWSPTERVERTFLRVFPYVLQIGAILVGSNQPIEVDRARVEARIADPAVQRYYGDAGVDIARAILPLLERARYFTPADPRVAAEEDINTDLYPRDEFQIPRVFDWYMLKPEGSR